MKNRLIAAALSVMLVAGCRLNAQSDSLGLQGDNLDLRAVLNIFKQSSNVEDFEKKLNSADTKVNNLDLNHDGQVDYLRVVDYNKDNLHSLVIQAPVSRVESQDVAVIQVEKKDDKTAHIQVVGDEALYGKNYIIEPSDAPAPNTAKQNNNTTQVASKNTGKNYDDDVYASPGNTSNTQDDNDDDYNNATVNANSGYRGNAGVAVNVWGWPCIGYMYSPGYSLWVSPWYWGYYPGWYSPWSPYSFYWYRQGLFAFNNGFYWRRCHGYRFPAAQNMYYGHRVASGYVQKTARNADYRINGGGQARGSMNGSGGTRLYNNSGGRNNGSYNSNRMNQGSGRSGGNYQGGQRMNQGGGGHFEHNSGGARMGGNGGGGGRMSGGGGGGARMGGGGGGGGHRR
jgi:hypothetical protein